MTAMMIDLASLYVLSLSLMFGHGRQRALACIAGDSRARQLNHMCGGHNEEHRILQEGAEVGQIALVRQALHSSTDPVNAEPRQLSGLPCQLRHGSAAARCRKALSA